MYHYSDRWVFVINTATSVVTFLMVFLIQRSQNKHTLALQLKVNELLAAHKHANNSLIAIEGLSENELRVLHSRFVRLGSLARDSAAPPSRVSVQAPEAPD
jgi:low affinity Fe/Cu permease